jgi:hypothetical protein
VRAFILGPYQFFEGLWHALPNWGLAGSVAALSHLKIEMVRPGAAHRHTLWRVMPYDFGGGGLLQAGCERAFGPGCGLSGDTPG